MDEKQTTDAEVEPEYRIELIYMQTGTTTPPGGMQAGPPRMAVRVTHTPTLTMAQCGRHRSQHRNKEAAMEMIEWALTGPTR